MGVLGPESLAPEGLHAGTGDHTGGQTVLVVVISVPGQFSHLDSILLFSPSTQLEDETLRHIQNYCHELVSLNLQSCSVSRHLHRMLLSAYSQAACCRDGWQMA